MRINTILSLATAVLINFTAFASEIINQSFSNQTDVVLSSPTDIDGTLYEGFQSPDQSHAGGAIVTEVNSNAIKTQVTSRKETVANDISWDGIGLPVNPITYVEITLPANQGALSSLSYSYGKSGTGYLWTCTRYLKDGAWYEFFDPVYKGTNGAGPWTESWTGGISNITKIRIYMWANGGTNPGDITIDDIVVNDAYNAGTTDGVDYVINNQWSMSGSGSLSRWNFNSIVTSGASTTELNNDPNSVNDWFVDQTASHNMSTAQGSSFDLTIKTNDQWSGGKVWIDWNHDGIFDEATEMMGHFVDDNANLASGAYAPYFGKYLPNGGNTITVYVPTATNLPTLPMTTRMRIKTTDIGYYNPDNLLPDDSRLGQAQDYAITITADDVIPYAPLTTSATNITPTGFTANWSETSATTYELKVYREESLTNLLTTISDIAGTNQYVTFGEAITAPLYFTVSGTNSAGTSPESVAQIVQTPNFVENALQLDGSNDLLEISGDFSSITDQITVSFWARGETGLANNFAFYGTNSAKNIRWASAHLPHAGTIYWDAGNPSDQRISKGASADMYSGQWNHWAFTKNATTGEMKIFHNGSEWHSGTGKGMAFNGDIAHFYIGADPNQGSKYNGKLAHFRIWNVAQDQATIAAEMNRAIPAATTGLVASYDWNDSIEDGFLNDSSGNGLTATVIGAPTIASPTKAVLSTAPTSVGATAFTANWESVEGAEKYFIEISTDSDFTTIYPQYNALEVSGNSILIDHAATLETTTYYRVRAFSTTDGFIGASNYQTVTTLAPSTDYITAVIDTNSTTVGSTITCTIYVKEANTILPQVNFDGVHNVKFSNFTAAPDSSYGSLNGTNLTTTEQAVPATFTDGVATVTVTINNATSSQLTLEVEDVISVGVYEPAVATVDISTMHGTLTELDIIQDITTSNQANGGIFPTQPIINLLDQFGNLCNTNSSTTLTASSLTPDDPAVASQTIATANSGVVTFTSLACMNTTDTDKNSAIKLTTDGPAFEVNLASVLVKGDSVDGGNCAILDGSTFFTIYNVNNISPSAMHSVSIEAWVYFDALPAAGARTAIIGSNDNGSYPGINFGITEDGALFMYAAFFPHFDSRRFQDAIGTSGMISAQQWYHVAFTYDHSATDKAINFYVDGQDAGVFDLADDLTTIWNKTLQLIGKSRVKGGQLAGKVDEIKIWKTARLQADIQADYQKVFDVDAQQTRATSPDDLVAYFNFDNVSGTTIVEMMHQDGYAEASAPTISWGPSLPGLTPVIGLEVIQLGNTLSWTVQDEVNVKEYRIVDVATGETIAIIQATGLSQYQADLPSDIRAKLVVVDNSGFNQTFYPENGDKATIEYNLTKGWNLITLPGLNTDLEPLRKVTTGDFWVWQDSSYKAVEQPQVTQGFWAYLEQSATITLTADKTDQALVLKSGWNLVGPVENSYAPSTAVIIYNWNQIYQQILENNILVKGVGYWMFSF